MKKLLLFADNNLLKIWVAFLIAFIPLYPKLPAIGIQHTWVYIRLEDFFILGSALIFFVQYIRRKALIFLPLSIPIFLYWIIGFFSLCFSLLFIAPHLANFFPTVAVLSYIRRIEYMILFFVGLSTVKNKKDLQFYFWVLVGACTAFFIYGIGQRYYLDFWVRFPAFFEKYSFCFPSFQTTNEEFAKGIPLCLPKTGRITSLFGGHYDLSAYLVLFIPLMFSVGFALKGFFKKIFIFLLSFGLVFLLILTASRISFAAYLIGVSFAFSFIKQKKYILPVIVISIIMLVTSSSSAFERFSQTFRFANIVLNQQGQVVGETTANLSDELKKKISKEKLVIDAPPPTQDLPTGSSYIALPGKSIATDSAVLKNAKKLTEAEKLRYRFGAIEISSVSGQFSIQKVLVYDISFTTRFQAEWPNSWRAFLRNPLLGSGYSTITLASDNSFLRALGETGSLGFISFLSFFLLWHIFLKKTLSGADKFTAFFALGLGAGIIGLFINALLIDVFEASKVAESMWLILGLSSGGLLLSVDKKIDFIGELKRVLSSHIFNLMYLLVLFFVFIARSFDNFFVADDFIKIKLAANSDDGQILNNFYNVQGQLFRPIEKLIFFIQYTFFAFNPSGYHIFILLFSFGASTCVYFLLNFILKKKSLAFLGAVIFSFLPSHAQNLYWISTLSITVSTFFVLLGLISYIYYKEKSKKLLFVLSLLSFLVAVFTHEMSVVFILLIFLVDFYLSKKITIKKIITLEIIIFFFIDIFYLFVRLIAHAGGFPGGYSYDLIKLIPNIIANFFGYLLLFVFGGAGNTFYLAIRNDTKTFFVPISILAVLLVSFISFTLFARRRKLSELTKSYRDAIFGFIFIFVSLLPFLGLGNISQNNSYLSSFGFVLILVVIFNKTLFSKLNDKKSYLILFAGVLILFSGVLYKAQGRLESQWDKTSKISYKTLATFRLDYEFLPKNSRVYFVNTPLNYGEAYIFPVGLADGMWFVYRDSTHRYISAKSLEKAKSMSRIGNETSKTGWIFLFDENYDLKEITE